MTLSDKIRSLYHLITVDPKLALQILIRRNTRNTWLKKKVINEQVNGIYFTFDFSLSNMIKYMYTGSYEIETYLALKKFLKKGDTFIDVGGNIGYITALGAGVVGKSGQVHAFEPIKKYYTLLNNVAINNPDYKIYANNYAISMEEGEAEITINSSDNIGNNSMVDKSMQENDKGVKETIKTINLTHYLTKNNLQPSLIKIDTEGFELTVLESLKSFIENTEKKPVIYCEVTPDAYHHLNKNIQDLASYLNDISYKAYSMNNLKKEINIPEVKERVDLVFMKHE